jgi:hypothetical protein
MSDGFFWIQTSIGPELHDQLIIIGDLKRTFNEILRRNMMARRSIPLDTVILTVNREIV